MTLDTLNATLLTAIDDRAIADGMAEIISSSLNAVDPFTAVKRAMQSENRTLNICGSLYDLRNHQRVVVISVGKAALAMARAAAGICGEAVTDAVVVCKHINPVDAVSLPAHFKLFQGGHPVPNAESINAGRAIHALLQGCTQQDLVICLISGGGSSLMTCPYEGISLADLHQLTGLLFACGASIHEINTIRKHIDCVKGGGLARAAAPARMITLVLSDVVGNPLDMVASGPTVADPTSFDDAFNLLEGYKLLESVPVSILNVLAKGRVGELAETLKPGDSILANHQTAIIGSNRLAAQAGVNKALSLGYDARVLTTYLQGDAREAGRFLGSLLREISDTGQPFARPVCLIAGGETTVKISGTGLGGRNLEVALSAAQEIAGLLKVAFISLATDGEDGPTDAAGAVVCGQTMHRAQLAGLFPHNYQKNNDTYHFFEPLQALLKIGSTGTNVNDLDFLFAWL